MKVALVHDLLCGYSGYKGYAGSERVVEQILRLYPDADLFSLVDFLKTDERDFIRNKSVKTSFLQHNPLARLNNSRFIPYFLPLMPLAVEDFDLSAYDLVISSSHSVSKGVITGPDQLHVSYIHSPLRYAWDFQHLYLRESGLDKGVLSWAMRWILHYMRIWDHRTAGSVDCLIANSYFIARRIMKVYRRESTVVYPPVDTDSFTLQEKKEDFYLVVSRMVPYKRVDIVVDAFSRMPDKRLVVVGDGPDWKKVRAKAGSNVTFLGTQDSPSLVSLMQRAQALIFAAQEDFGITPLEAQASGTPVIAFGRGAIEETVKDLSDANPTGVFFMEQSAASIGEAIAAFERVKNQIDPKQCRKNALRFAPENFRHNFQRVIEKELDEFCKRRNLHKQHPPN